MSEITYQMMLSTLQTASLMIGVLYYLFIMRNAQKTRELTLKAQEHALETRQAQLYNSIWNQSMNNPQFQKQYMRLMSLQWKNFDEFIELFPYPDFESENSMAMWGVGLFFEGLAPLVREGLLNIQYLTGTIGGLLRTYWSKMEPIVNEAREFYNDPSVFGQAEYLYNELTKYHEEHPELKT